MRKQRDGCMDNFGHDLFPLTISSEICICSSFVHKINFTTVLELKADNALRFFAVFMYFRVRYSAFNQSNHLLALAVLVGLELSKLSKQICRMQAEIIEHMSVPV